MVGAVFLEEIVIKRGITEFPGMHEEPANLIAIEIEPIFPDIAIFDIAIFLYFEVVGKRRKISSIAAEDAAYRVVQIRARRHIGCEIDGVRQQTSLRRLSPLVDSKKGMSEHRGRIVHERGREDKRDRLG